MTIRELTERFEQYVVSIMAGRKERFADHLFRGWLFTLSRLFRAIVRCRLHLYSERIFRQHILGCQVISVGNLTVGGTGKTPVVEFLTKTLLRKKRKVAILSRGYRSKSKPFLQKLKDKFDGKEDLPRIVSDGQNLLLDSAQAGDEPYMLAKNLPGAFMLVDKDRVKSGRYATRRLGADIIILDDGFQYLRLRPSYNICLVDATNPFHNHHVLPRGLLREPVKHIKRANLIFLTKCNQRGSMHHLKSFIHKHNRHAKIIECAHQPVNLVEVFTGETVPLDYLKGKKIAALSGIAAPKGFEESLVKMGSEMLHVERFADHHRFRSREIKDCFKASVEAGAEVIITTEKDAVRIPTIEERPIPMYYLKIEIGIYHGEEYFDEFISKVLIEPRF